MSGDTETNFARVGTAAYETATNRTAVTIYVPGRHHLQPGELISITTKASKK